MVAHSHNEQVFDKNNIVFSSFTHSSDWDEWLDDLLCYDFFNRISVISGDEWMIMKGCLQWNPIYY